VIQRPYFDGLDRSSRVLAVRAEESLTEVTGRAAPRFSAEGFLYAPSADSTERRAKLYWRRWSPHVMASLNVHSAGIDRSDPPQSHPGSATVILTPLGKMLSLSIVPDLRADSTAQAVPQWAAVLRAAEADPAATPVAEVPTSFLVTADTVAAWRLSQPGTPETTIVAAALRGRIVEVSTYAAGKTINARPDAAEPDETSLPDWIRLLLFQLLPIIGGLVLTRRNLRAGRGDVRGALTLGTVIAMLYILDYVFTVRAGEVGLYKVLSDLAWQAPLGHALIHAVTMTIAYLAIEPYVRRLWPTVLVSWARLVVGRWRDPIVGRDVLVGTAAGVVLSLLSVAYEWSKRALGLDPAPYQPPPAFLAQTMGASAVLATTASACAVSMLTTTVIFTAVVIARFFLRNNTLAIIALILIVTATEAAYGTKAVWLSLLNGTLIGAFSALVALRVGYVAAIVTGTVSWIALDFPFTTDFSTWFAPQTLLGWAIVAGLTAYGLSTALGGRTVFSDPLSDPVTRSDER
jgi:serine/threonine-protein kinase